MNLKNIYFALISLMLIGFISCEDEKSSDTNSPGQITNIQFTPQNGGGYFTYTIPTDPDFLYVRADYTVDTGAKVSKTSSTYKDTLFIEGLGTIKEYPVTLYTIDRDGNTSAPIVQKITPLASNISAVINTVSVKAGFSSLVISWKNTLKQTMDVYVTVKTGDKQGTKVQTSNLASDYFTYPNLEGIPYTVSVYIKDSYGNKTEEVPIGSFTPMIDGKISKKQWSFLNDPRLYGNKWDVTSGTDASKQQPYKQYLGSYRSDSLKNAREVNLEGNIAKFFNDVIDDRFKQTLDYFHTGTQLCPFSYFLDMGRTIRASRFRYWQRDCSTQYYTGENVQTFQLWISDDQDPTDGISGWELVGTYTIIKPSDAVEAENTARAGHEFLLYPDNPKFTKPFRYLRYKAKKYFRGTASTGGCASEITIYGTEADGSISKE